MNLDGTASKSIRKVRSGQRIASEIGMLVVLTDEMG